MSVNNKWPFFTEDMINSVTEVLKNGSVNQWTGDYVKQFEKKFASYIGVKYTVALSNGTTALEVCLKSLGISEGDQVIVTSRTFVASAMTIVFCGATPIFVDVEYNSQNIDINMIKKAINNKTKAIIAVHHAGWPCKLDKIKQLCDENNIYLIEDCAQAHGAKYNNKFIGTWGDINAWSFCQDKIITTGGEGGMISTNNYDLFKIAWSFKDHGKSYELSHKKREGDKYIWLHETVGTNMRMTSIQAVIGSIALNHLNNWITHRRAIANIYSKVLSSIDGVSIPLPNDIEFHVYYKYYFTIDPLKFNRDLIIKKIKEHDIYVGVGSCGEIYKEKALIRFKPKSTLINSKTLFENSIMLLCDPTISVDTAINNISIIKNILTNTSDTHYQ